MDAIEALKAHSDPRITSDYVRSVSGITLVGVVHDHPASAYRVTEFVEALEPDVLALELPPLAIPLFESYAQTDRESPLFGGEMSAAIQAATTANVVGIDRPTGRFFGELLADILRERPSLSTVRNVLSNTASATTHALICRFAAEIAARTSIRLEVDIPIVHETDRSDSPATQAHDERTQVRRSRAFMDAFQTADSARASRLEDTARERHMADRLSRLRSEGDIVAVVGIHHLDSLADRLTPANTRD